MLSVFNDSPYLAVLVSVQLLQFYSETRTDAHDRDDNNVNKKELQTIYAGKVDKELINTCSDVSNQMSQKALNKGEISIYSINLGKRRSFIFKSKAKGNKRPPETTDNGKFQRSWCSGPRSLAF